VNPPISSAAQTSQRATMAPPRDSNLDSHHSDLNMNGFCSKYLRFLGPPKRCPYERNPCVIKGFSRSTMRLCANSNRIASAQTLNPNTTSSRANFAAQVPLKNTTAACPTGKAAARELFHVESDLSRMGQTSRRSCNRYCVIACWRTS